MAEDGYLLSEEDARVLQALIARERARINNTQNRPDRTDALVPPPKLFIARAPAGGIPAIGDQLVPGGSYTGTGSGFADEFQPSSAECEVHRITVDNTTGVAELDDQYFTQTVYNLSDSAIPEDAWVLLGREEYGSWVAIQLIGAADTPVFSVARGYDPLGPSTPLNDGGAYNSPRRLLFARNDGFKLHATNHQTQLNGAITSGTASITVDSLSQIISGDVIQVDDELMLVGATTGTTVAAVTRGYQSSTASAHADNTFVYLYSGQAGYYVQVTMERASRTENGILTAGTAIGGDGEQLLGGPKHWSPSISATVSVTVGVDGGGDHYPYQGFLFCTNPDITPSISIGGSAALAGTNYVITSDTDASLFLHSTNVHGVAVACSAWANSSVSVTASGLGFGFGIVSGFLLTSSDTNLAPGVGSYPAYMVADGRGNTFAGTWYDTPGWTVQAGDVVRVAGGLIFSIHQGGGSGGTIGSGGGLSATALGSANSNGASVSTLSFGPATVPAGSRLVVTVAVPGGTGISDVTFGGVSLTAGISVFGTAGFLQSFSHGFAGATTSTVVVTLSPAKPVMFLVKYISGTASGEDVAGSASGSGTPSVPTSGATSVASEFLDAAFLLHKSGGATAAGTWDSPFASAADLTMTVGSDGYRLESGFDFTAATGTFTAALMGSTQDNWDGIITSFK